MKITKFKKVGVGKYKIYIDNGTTEIFYEDVIVNNNLLLNKELTNDKLSKLIKDNYKASIYSLAYNYISKSLRSKKEIEEYLTKKGYDPNLVLEVIKTLIKKDYINDFSYAKSFINDRINITNYGPYKIKKDLFDKGINEEIIHEVFEDIDNDIFNNKLSNLINKYFKLNNKKASAILKMKALNYFVNLGYSKEQVIFELDKIVINSNSDYIKKEYDKLYSKYSKKYKEEYLENFIRNKLYQKGFSIDDLDKIKKD